MEAATQDINKAAMESGCLLIFPDGMARLAAPSSASSEERSNVVMTDMKEKRDAAAPTMD
ncbi:hypothetical protein E2C01_060349 [Portunus trituberculatus]|uniref:Uncharacterized protein n=1 Tax=Portunus trituberculatus TaxID=210409 RepID=A0A5B7H7S7_PORTR|nr:hypothetical protein [Portunus trituberculatus]